MTTTLAEQEVFGSRLAVGTVTAKALPDGKVVVENVPVFAEVRPTDPAVKDGAREIRTREWLETALKRSQVRAQEFGYLPPMTLRHHFDKPEAVGTFVLTHIEDAEINPDEGPRAVLFAKKIYDSIDAFNRAKDYPYRSPEISPDDPKELSALALLKATAPFNKFPSTLEKLEAETREAFESAGIPSLKTIIAEVFKARRAQAPQTWKNRAEVFASAQDKEGGMPAPDVKDEKKGAPSIEERMEACFVAFEERMEACFVAFEERLGKAGGLKDDKGEKKPEASEAKPDEEKKKTESSEAAGPNGNLPAAVSSARPGESFTANGAATTTHPAVNGATLTQAEKLELFGLRAYVQKKQREEQIESFAQAGEQALVKGGIAVDGEIRAMIRQAATDLGEAGVKQTVATISRFAGTARAPEAFGAFNAAQAPGQKDPHADLKKAIEAFGAAGERTKQEIQSLYGEWLQAPEHFRRNASFVDVCRGNPRINPTIMGDRGGAGGRS